MKLYRFIHDDRIRWGTGEGTILREVRAADIFEPDLIEDYRRGHDEFPLASLQLLAPVTPGKIIGIGRNYADHAKELGNDAPAEPLLFLKAPSAVLDPEKPIAMPAASARVDFEGELAIVIGRVSRNVPRSRWREHVLGFTCANDVTARDLQKQDVQFARAKSFDTFCPIGPCINTALDVADLALTTEVNGEIRQNGRTSSMIFPPDALIEYVTACMTLYPGDVILTGTPAGVGPLAEGDTVSIAIEGIGTLRNRVTRAAE